jgi:hypothetical protein
MKYVQMFSGSLIKRGNTKFLCKEILLDKNTTSECLPSANDQRGISAIEAERAHTEKSVANTINLKIKEQEIREARNYYENDYRFYAEQRNKNRGFIEKITRKNKVDFIDVAREEAIKDNIEFDELEKARIDNKELRRQLKAQANKEALDGCH